MTELPSIELLEATHSFPCPYVFKVIGRAEIDFVARVIAAVREALEMIGDPPFHVREAVGGRHIAVTVEPLIWAAQQVLAVYKRIRTTPGIVMLW